MGALRRLMHRAVQKIYRTQQPPPPPPQQQQAPAPAPGLNPRVVDSIQQQKENVAAAEEGQMSFEVDWSIFSLEFLTLAIQDFLFGLAGLPVPVDPSRKRQQHYTLQNGYWRSNLNLDELYRQELREGVEPGFLIRGVIYDMAAIATPPYQHKEEDGGGRDWSSLIYENVHARKDDAANVETVSAEQVMENLGLKNNAGVKERVGGLSSASLRKQQLAGKQKLEEILGKGDSIRAKYADRLRLKQVLAEARREQGKLGISITTLPSDGTSSVMPGSPSLVRYLEERGVAQALLTRGADSEVKSMLNQLGNFQFQEVRRLESSSPLGEESFSEGVLHSICSKWGLSSKQVLVVIGGSGESEGVLKTVADSGYFICRVDKKSEKQQQSSASRGDSDSPQPSGAVSNWFNQLAEGTLHLEQQQPKPSRSSVHFTVMDMTELKWVIEDLNGVSYRSSTILRGFK